MAVEQTTRAAQCSAVFNFLSGLVLLAMLAFISGCLLDQGTRSRSTSALGTAPGFAPGFGPTHGSDESASLPVPSLLADDSRLSTTRDMNEREVLRRSEAIDLSARYLANACEPNGRFVYKINLDPRITHEPRYNLLRHCGAMYALGMYHDWEADPEIRDALERASAFLQSQCIDTVPGHEDLLAVWSHPEITHGNSPLQAKLGGSGLGLVALTNAKRIIPGSVPIQTVQRLGRFILFMQKPDGSFNSKFIPEKGGRQDQWTSLYYPGEAALGLLMLHEIDPDPRWINGAIDALEYLARSRQDLDTVPADHWTLLATAKLFDIANDYRMNLERDRLIAHAVQVCESIMQEQVRKTDSPRLLGGFAPDGRTTPTATRLEGLLAAYDFIPASQSDVKQRMAESIHLGMVFMNNAQVRTGEHAGAVPRAVMILPDNGSSEVRAFNRRAGEVRIDYVQHAMCAMIQYVRALSPTSTSAAQSSPW